MTPVQRSTGLRLRRAKVSNKVYHGSLLVFSSLISFLPCLPFFLRLSLSVNPEFTELDWDTPASAAPVLRLQRHATMSSFYERVGSQTQVLMLLWQGLNSKLSPKPSILPLNHIRQIICFTQFTY